MAQGGWTILLVDTTKASGSETNSPSVTAQLTGTMHAYFPLAPSQSTSILRKVSNTGVYAGLMTQGTMFTPVGSVYTGAIRNGKREGEVVLTH